MAWSRTFKVWRVKGLLKGKKGTESWLPWEFGSGKVSLATKCITVVFPKGSLRAGRGERERKTESGVVKVIQWATVWVCAKSLTTSLLLQQLSVAAGILLHQATVQRKAGYFDAPLQNNWQQVKGLTLGSCCSRNSHFTFHNSSSFIISDWADVSMIAGCRQMQLFLKGWLTQLTVQLLISLSSWNHLLLHHSYKLLQKSFAENSNSNRG